MLRDLLDILFVLPPVQVVKQQTYAQDCHEGTDLDQPGQQTVRIVDVLVERSLDLKVVLHCVAIYKTSCCCTVTIALGKAKVVGSHGVFSVKPVSVKILVERGLILIDKE